MRVGQNPAKFVDTVAQPADITVSVVNFIPSLTGFYSQSLEVLKICLNSIHQNTDLPHDLMVFDNKSCPEVRQFLIEAYEQGVIQYLVLSGKNIGKIGAWNYMFGAAQGKYVAFADGDIYFRPGWLQGSLALMDTFPKVGMVTARPIRTPDQFSQSTLLWGKQQGESIYREGVFLDWNVYLEHTDSIGMTHEEARKQYEDGRDYILTYQGHRAYSGAAHFQFLTNKDVLAKVMPLPSEKPMRGERAFDIAVDTLGFLRLCTEKPYVYHMGNFVDEITIGDVQRDGVKDIFTEDAVRPLTTSTRNQMSRGKKYVIKLLQFSSRAGVVNKILFWIYSLLFEYYVRAK